MEEKVLNLCEILKGCEGIELYCTTYGNVVFYRIVVGDIYPIRCKLSSGSTGEICITKEGKLLNSYDGECILFPSKEQRDWSKFEKPIKKGTPIMCCDSHCSGYPWYLGYYDGFYKAKGCDHEHHIVKYNPHHNDGIYKVYVIPFDKFNPNDIEESLKYNIQK